MLREAVRYAELRMLHILWAVEDHGCATGALRCKLHFLTQRPLKSATRESRIVLGPSLRLLKF